MWDFCNRRLRNGNAHLPELGLASLSWWSALPIAVGVTVLAGMLLGVPVLNMRGDYLAIVTLGFGEIIRLLALSDALRPWTGGSQGIQLIAKPVVGTVVLDDQLKLYYLILAGCLLAGFISSRLRDSRLGRAWMAMREDEDVAQAIGINLVATKLLAFSVGAAFGGLSGAIFAAGGHLPQQLRLAHFNQCARASDYWRHGQHSRRDSWCARAGGPARVAARVCGIPAAGIRRAAGDDDALPAARLVARRSPQAGGAWGWRQFEW